MGEIKSYLIYHQRKIYILTVPPPTFPTAYFAYGNATESCKIVTDPDDNLFRMCEDVKILPRLEGQLGRRNLLVSCDPGRPQWNTVLVSGPSRWPSCVN